MSAVRAILAGVWIVDLLGMIGYLLRGNLVMGIFCLFLLIVLTVVYDKVR